MRVVNRRFYPSPRRSWATTSPWRRRCASAAARRRRCAPLVERIDLLRPRHELSRTRDSRQALVKRLDVFTRFLDVAARQWSGDESGRHLAGRGCRAADGAGYFGPCPTP
jgi:hypothetical protein